jgi:hypothetical protein
MFNIHFLLVSYSQIERRKTTKTNEEIIKDIYIKGKANKKLLFTYRTP